MSDSGGGFLIKFIAVVVTLLTCYAFYQLRMTTTKEQNLADSMKVIQAAAEIVKNLSEKAMPNLRNRVDDLESKGRIIEQNQRRLTTIIPEISAATTISTAQQQQVSTDAEILAARKAQRTAAS